MTRAKPSRTRSITQGARDRRAGVIAGWWSDALAISVLTALLLYAMAETFADLSYLVVGMVAAAAALVSAMLVRERGRGVEWHALVLVLLYPPLAALVALGNHDYLGLPAPSAMLRVLQATWMAPAELLTTIPPLDTTGEVMVLPFALAYFAVGLSAWLAIATVRPFAPVVPLLTALAIAVLLGSQQAGALLERSVAFAAVALAWTGIRAGRQHAVVGWQRGLLIRGVTAIVLASSVAWGLGSMVLPQLSVNDRVVLRGQVGKGADVSQADRILPAIRRYRATPVDGPPSLAEQPLLKITGLPEKVPIRFVTLDKYDGRGWLPDNRTVEGTTDDLFQRIASRIAPQRSGPSSEVSVQVEPAYVGDWLPLAGEVTSIEFDYIDRETQRSDLRYNPITTSALVLGGVRGGDDYTFRAEFPDTSLTPEDEPWGGAAPEGGWQPEGRPLDPFLKPWRRDFRSPIKRVYALAEYLATEGRYTDGTIGDDRFRPGHDIERLGWLFIGTKHPVGNDEQYAAFVALAANRLGVPARVVVGARPGAQGVVKGNDVQAWVELRVADGSWRTLPRSLFLATAPPEPDLTGKPDQEALAQWTLEENRKEQDAAARERQHLQEDRLAAKHQARQQMVWWSALGGALLMLVALGAPLTKLVRRRLRLRGAPQRRVQGTWRELTDAARDLGLPVPRGVTRPRQAAALGAHPELRELADQADAMTFSGAPVTTADALEFGSRTNEQIRRLRREAPRSRRWRAAWSLSSLRRDRTRPHRP